MRIFKKNQLALLVISLMLITAGYLNYSSTYTDVSETSADAQNTVDLASVGDAELVNTNVVEETKTENVVTEVKTEKEQEATPKVENTGRDYFTTSKLERNIMYSQMIERYQEVLGTSSGYSEQKSIAEQEINNINELQNAIMIAENLLTTKGFTENVIFVNGESISVIIGKENLTQDEIAQVQNIVSRELKAEVNNIHISMK